MSEDGRRRARILLVMLAAALVFLTGRLWQLQVVHGERYVQLADGNRLRRVPIPAPRGSIYDAHGRLVVGNRLAFTVSVVPGGLSRDEEVVVARLSRLLGVPEEAIYEGLRNGRTYPYVPIRVLRDVPLQAVLAIEENRIDLPGVLIEEEPVREYPYGKTASHVFGYLQPISREELAALEGYRATDLIGRTGLERRYEHWLRGVEGSRLVEVNALSRAIRQLSQQPPRPGHDLYLTLDLELQQAAEEALAQQLAALAQDPGTSGPPPVAGAVVALDPRTGAVRALVSHPGFDPNRFLSPGVGEYFRQLEDDRGQPLVNRFLMGQYPPGSAFKPVSAVAILESGAIGVDEEYYATGVVDLGGGVVKRNWTVPLGLPAPGWIDVRGALEQSTNDFFYVHGAKAGIEALASTARRFGLGSPTGVDLEPQERSGLVGDPAWKRASRAHLPVSEQRWYPSETMDVAIGQGPVLVTPMQLALVYMGLANRGEIFRPYLVERVMSVDGELVYEHEKELAHRIQLPSRMWQAIHEGLIRVAHGRRGTARAAFQGTAYTVAGKTGTAEVYGQPSHAWFAAYAPAEDPQLVVVVLVEHGGGGGRAAAPVARRVFDAYFRLQEIRAGMNTAAEKLDANSRN